MRQHKRSQVCVKVNDTEASCCGCRDTRSMSLPKLNRIADYCRTCNLFWLQELSDNCPREWNLLKCQHKRSQACVKVDSAKASGCVCKDERRVRLAKAEGLEEYCESCSASWNPKPDDELPASWKLACAYGVSGRSASLLRWAGAAVLVRPNQELLRLAPAPCREGSGG